MNQKEIEKTAVVIEEGLEIALRVEELAKEIKIKETTLFDIVSQASHKTFQMSYEIKACEIYRALEDFVRLQKKEEEANRIRMEEEELRRRKRNYTDRYEIPAFNFPERNSTHPKILKSEFIEKTQRAFSVNSNMEEQEAQNLLMSIIELEQIALLHKFGKITLIESEITKKMKDAIPELIGKLLVCALAIDKNFLTPYELETIGVKESKIIYPLKKNSFEEEEVFFIVNGKICALSYYGCNSKVENFLRDSVKKIEQKHRFKFFYNPEKDCDLVTVSQNEEEQYQRNCLRYEGIIQIAILLSDVYREVYQNEL